jgi:hypothetical protein
MHGLDDGDVELLERAGKALAILFGVGAVVCLVGYLVNGAGQ